MQRFRCIVCEKEIDAIHFETLDAEHPEQGMWDNGTVEVLYMPYGSSLDGDVYVFGLCDDCIKDKFNKGIIGKKIKGYL